MIGIIILVLIARTIGNLAEDKGKHKYGYWALTAVAWYAPQFLTGIILGLFLPLDTLENPLINIGLGIVTGAIGVGVLYWYVGNLPEPLETEDSLINQIGKDTDAA